MKVMSIRAAKNVILVTFADPLEFVGPKSAFLIGSAISYCAACD